MKDGLRFVDCDMHIMEPPDLFERYLDPAFKHRVILPIGYQIQMGQVWNLAHPRDARRLRRCSRSCCARTANTISKIIFGAPK